MNKKGVLILIALVVFELFLVNSFADDNASIEHFEENLIENITSESRAIPESVKRALMDYIEAKKIDEEIQKAKEADQQKKEKLDKTLLIIASILVFSVLIYLFKKTGFFRRTGRFFRRQILYHHIIKLSKKGIGGKDILKVLQIKGYQRKHIDDALSRFKSMLRDKGVPSKLELWGKDRNVRGAVRRIRRQYLYFRIRLYILFGNSVEDAGNKLIKKGWQPLYVNDAVYRYQVYVQGRKNPIIKFFTWFFGISFFHKIKRSARRKILYKKIKELKKKGFSHSKVLSELKKQGYEEKHIEDAYYRLSRSRYDYRKASEGEFSLMNVWPLRPIRRLSRRKKLLSKIRKFKKYGESDEKIISELEKQGYDEHYIIDALYLYKVYTEIKNKHK